MHFFGSFSKNLNVNNKKNLYIFIEQNATTIHVKTNEKKSKKKKVIISNKYETRCINWSWIRKDTSVLKYSFMKLFKC